MTKLVPVDAIEQTVGAPRHRTLHLGRAVSAEQVFYILHSKECIATGTDLRDCAYSHALAGGIDDTVWQDSQDTTVVLRINRDWDDLEPVRPYTVTERVADIYETLLTTRPTFRDEADLQAEIAEALAAAGIAATREVPLSDGASRIDLLAWDVGIEVKIAGSTPAVRRQLARYAQCPEIAALVLVTVRASHHAPATLGGKPVIVCSLIGGGL